MSKRLTALLSLLFLIGAAWLSFSFFGNKDEFENPSLDELTEITPTPTQVKPAPSKQMNPAVTTNFNKENIPSVSIEEISNISTEQEASILFQRLSTELIHELKELETTTDPHKITSRLTPLVRNFYYLKRRNLISQPQQRLPQTFQADIQQLEQLWNDNITLAQTADGIFSRFDLLQHEHIPYQLRTELTIL